MFVTRNVMMKYRAPAGETGDTGGGGETSGAAAIAAALAATEAAAAAKVVADAEAATALAAAEAAKLTGKTGPTDEEAKLLKEVMDKKTKLKESADAIATLQASLKQFEGIDPVAVRALLDAKKVEADKKLADSGEWDRLKAQMNDEHGKQISAVQAVADAAAAEAVASRNTIAELTVGNAFAGSTFIKDELAMPTGKVRAFFGPNFEFKDGAVIAFDKPAGAAERTMLVDAKGEPLSFELAIEKLIDADPDRDSLRKSKMKAGSGSKTVAKAGDPAARFDEPRGVSKISAALAKNVLTK